MCGIVGFVGNTEAANYLVAGLRRLEYRGYDSAGVATIDRTGSLCLTKSTGRIARLEQQLDVSPTPGVIGIGHTRWATHGEPTDINAHPHLGGDGEVCIVHNGVIENYRAIRTQLESQGYEFRTATDTEVISHLIADNLKRQPAPTNGDPYEHLITAVQVSLARLQGTYGLVVLFHDYPEVLIAARLGSPLIIGVSEDVHYVASDASPLVGYTDQIVYMADHEMAVLTADSLRVIHRDQGQVRHDVKVLDTEAGDVDLGDFDHFMLKEIFEQPETLKNTMRGRLNFDEATAHFGGLRLSPQQLRRISRIILTACGTSWHAGLVGEYQIEALARMSVEVEYASELRYRNPPLDAETLLFAITQSGETIDTLAALREMQRKGVTGLAICNVIGSTIAQESDGGIYLYAGPEIGVASTKAFTSQCLTLGMLALHLGRMRHISFEQGLNTIRKIQDLPGLIERALQSNDSVRRIAEKYAGCNNFLYLGRQYNFPVALEGALKLKEISYIHAEGYPAAEMKHGPIALVDKNTPSVFVMPKDSLYGKVVANLQEIKARGGPVIAVVSEGDSEVAQIADDVIEVPTTLDFLQPIVSIIPLQLLSYHIAVMRGCDVDKPRNLAKSVTVE